MATDLISSYGICSKRRIPQYCFSFFGVFLFAASGIVLGELESKSIRSPSGAPVVEMIARHPVVDKRSSMRFSAVVDLSLDAKASGALRTAQSDINFDADLACLVIRQIDADGNDLVIDASLGVAKPGRHQLSVEAAPVPGVSEVVLECRMAGLSGKAVFSDFEWDPQSARLYDTASTRRVIAIGKTPALEIDGRIVPPLMVHGQNLETSDDAAASIEDSKLPYANGLRLFSLNAWFPGVTRQNTAANLQSLVREFPEAYFMMRVWLGPRGQFFKDYPDERLVMDDGNHTADMATPTSDVWRRYVEASVRRFALEMRKLPEVERLAGIVPMYYVTGEWQLGDPGSPYKPKSALWRMSGFGEPHRKAFADRALEAYGGLAEVNAAWGTAYGSPDEIAIPTAEERERASWGVLRDPGKDRRVIDHSRFLSLSVSDAILWSSRAFRMAFEDRILTGPFYGHILEHAWSATGVQQQGHLAIGRLLDSPFIDFHGSPYSYSNDSRFPGLPMVTNAILDSAGLHGKAAFLEEDTFTHIAKPPEGFIAPGAHQKTNSLEETLDVLKRNLGTSLARGYIHYWMGLLQDGRFNLPEIWDAYKPVFEWLKADPVRPAYRPQVAMVVDENALPYLAEGDRAVVGRWLYELRNILARVDTTVGIYLQSDLDKIPDSVRCLVLATPYEIDAKAKEALRTRWMRDGRVIVFCQFPDAFTEAARLDPPGAITGMNLKVLDRAAQPVSTVTADGLFGPWAEQTVGAPLDRAVIYWRPNATLPPIGPIMVVDDPEAVPLARYNALPGKPVSVAMKQMEGWTSVFTGVHSLTPAMWRTLAAAGGTHLYLDNPSEDFDRPDVIEATDDFLMVISGRDGGRTLSFLEPVKLVPVDGGSGSSETLSKSHQLRLEAGKPRLFRLERGGAVNQSQ